MSPLELIIRTAAAALLIACALGLALRDEEATTRRLLALVCLGIAAFVVGSAPGFYRAAGPAFAAFAHALCNATPILVWLLAKSWFGRGFVPTRRHAALAAAYALAMLTADYGRFGVGPFGLEVLALTPDNAVVSYVSGRVLGALAVLSALWETLTRRADDLVEPRRRARVVFFAALAGHVAVLAGSELLFGRQGAPRSWVMLGNSVLLLGAAALLLTLMVDRTRKALVASWETAVREPPPTPATQEEPATVNGREPQRRTIADARLAALAQAAEQAMAQERLYRRDDLGIAVLAQHLGCAEYQLRRAINGCLGYRNFSDFVHTWRLREAADRLGSRAFDDQSILDVALEVGFASIGPFNRAFKSRFGTTPSAYRARGAARQ